MYNILKLNSISDLVTKVFDENYQLSTENESPDAVLVRSFQMADYLVSPNLLAVGRAGAGVNNIPFVEYAKRGIVVFNTPGANANAVKELVIAGLLLSNRRIYEGIEWAQSLNGKGEEVKNLVEKGKAQFVGCEITGKTLGVIGLGAIGSLVANSAIALGMNVIGYDPCINSEIILDSQIKLAENIDEVYACSHFITLHVPYMVSTKHMINADSINKMKDGVAIINCSRGELVNNEDIINAISDNKVSKYFTDFPTEDLLGINNIITCPHLGASTPEAEDNCAVMVATQIKDYIENGNIKNSVNYPVLSIPRKTANRVTILGDINYDIINKTAQILNDSNIKTLAYGNAVKGDSAYIIIDTEKKLPSNVVEKIKALKGVYRLRLL